jgi:hypothetical protein
MNELIGAVFSQSARTHIDLCNRRELLEKNLNRIFAGQGIVELWEHEKESVAIHELTFPSSEAFRTNHMVRLHSRNFGKVQLTALGERRPGTLKA